MEKTLILGAKGMLGQELVKIFGNGVIGWDRKDADVLQFKDLKLKIEKLSPSAIINCVAYNDVDGAEENKDLAFALNAELPGNLASFCKELGISLVHISTSYVFDGERGGYKEDEQPNPQSVYAKSKYEGELAVQKNLEKHYVVRTAVLFGIRGASSQTKKSFVQLMLDLSEKTIIIKAVSDEINNTTSVVDLSREIKLLLEQGKPYGIYHIVNSGQTSWYEYAKEIFKITGKTVNVVPVPRTEFPRKAKTPKYGTLLNTKLPPLRPWQEALKEYLK